MQSRDALPFSIAQVIENARKEKSHFFFSTPRNGMDAVSG
jgi:hypothetical protein